MSTPPRSRADGVGLELLEIITEKHLDPGIPLLGMHAKVVMWESLRGGVTENLDVPQRVVRPPKTANTEGMAKELLHNHNMKFFLKSRDISLLTKVHIVKAVVCPVVMYRCECWTVKKAKCQIIDACELCWRRLLRVPWTARRSNQSILKEISPDYLLEGHAEVEAPIL